MTFSVVPSDQECFKAWQQIAEIVRAHCLVVQAAGGVMLGSRLVWHGLCTREAKSQVGL